jgi:hypothetical protein
MERQRRQNQKHERQVHEVTGRQKHRDTVLERWRRSDRQLKERNKE